MIIAAAIEHIPTIHMEGLLRSYSNYAKQASPVSAIIVLTEQTPRIRQG
jgi:hypothetical protein